MCGIVATFNNERSDVLYHMLDALAHRGEDAPATRSAGPAALGIYRLPIVDIAGGAQPLSDPEGEIHVVCNGEIYNHEALRKARFPDIAFKSRSDAEVIVALYKRYGINGWNWLQGMFSFVLYDGRTREIFAARDRYGIKPLYYAEAQGALYFASEIKSLFSANLSLSDIHIVPPGHVMTSSGMVPWVSPSEPTSDMPPSPAACRRLLEASVERHLVMDEGVKVGVFLSGGLDSSILAALAKQKRHDVVALSIGFRGSEDVQAACLASKWLSMRHIVRWTEMSEVKRRLRAAVWFAESYNPVIVMETLLTMLLAECAAENGLKVVLSGEGADELFAGYGLFSHMDPDRRLHTRRELLRHIGDTECRRLDRGTMAATVEARVPFLDHALVDWAMRLPDETLVGEAGGRSFNKFILRSACKDLLPPELIWRKKLAFDHGTGILGLLDEIDLEIGDEAFSEARQLWPMAQLGSKMSLYLFRYWCEFFGAPQCDRAYRLCGHYPTLQGMIDARTSAVGGTGELVEPLAC